MRKGNYNFLRIPPIPRIPWNRSGLGSGKTFVAKWGNSYKVVQYRRQMKETGERDFDNLLIHSPLICLASDTLPLEIIEKLKLKSKERRRNHTPTTLRSI